MKKVNAAAFVRELVTHEITGANNAGVPDAAMLPVLIAVTSTLANAMVNAASITQETDPKHLAEVFAEIAAETEKFMDDFMMDQNTKPKKQNVTVLHPEPSSIN